MNTNSIKKATVSLLAVAVLNSFLSSRSRQPSPISISVHQYSSDEIQSVTIN